jgi:alpha-beta hydrolase superfamily lysophospholipase
MHLLATLTLLAGFAQPAFAGSSEIEPVRLETTDGYTLRGEFWTPRKKGRAPAALLLHDTLRDRSDYSEIAALLNKRGFCVLSIDLRGHGESVTEEYEFAKLTEEQQARSWTLAIRDLEACAAWLRKRDEVHASNLSLVAHGAASVLAARYAERDENVRSIALLAPKADDLAKDLPRTLRRIAGLPTLLVTEKTGRADAVRLVEASFKDEELDLDELVEISVMRSKDTELMRDKRMPAVVASFLRKHAISED